MIVANAIEIGDATFQMSFQVILMVSDHNI